MKRRENLRAKRVPAIYREALQEIVDSDPVSLDAQRIAAKALGDADEFLNTGRVRWNPPRCLRGRQA